MNPAAPRATSTLLLLIDADVVDLLPFCVDAFCREGPSLAILGDHVGTGLNDFPSFLAGELHGVGVNALQRGSVPIRAAGNRIVLAVVVGGVLNSGGLPLGIRPCGSDLDALSRLLVV